MTVSATINLYSEFDALSFETENETELAPTPTIWIRANRRGRDVVSLDLDRDDRAKLRSALDRADAIADKT